MHFWTYLRCIVAFTTSNTSCGAALSCPSSRSPKLIISRILLLRVNWKPYNNMNNGLKYFLKEHSLFYDMFVYHSWNQQCKLKTLLLKMKITVQDLNGFSYIWRGLFWITMGQWDDCPTVWWLDLYFDRLGIVQCVDWLALRECKLTIKALIKT